ncbi:hypothetical protein JQ616_10035 [Bradyrhizobium tropiciagri]|uniref:hypothetical protein n=1 Tax=Bradyrhizobium tropiciagri TaxID=312253 RepID=UPI001BAC4C6D|nr:hypothetical protein [Bradyrhizobium tropiciagri]MBR0895286.1 hypothetical protein [Bradyrhizobium tropiciagri]
MSAAGTVDADAAPTSEKVNPAAPNAGTAALATRLLVTRLLLGACFTRAILASSIPDVLSNSTLAQLYNPSQLHARHAAHTHSRGAGVYQVLSFIFVPRFILMNTIIGLRARPATFVNTSRISMLHCDHAGAEARNSHAG